MEKRDAYLRKKGGDSARITRFEAVLRASRDVVNKLLYETPGLDVGSTDCTLILFSENTTVVFEREALDARAVIQRLQNAETQHPPYGGTFYSQAIETVLGIVASRPQDRVLLAFLSDGRPGDLQATPPPNKHMPMQDTYGWNKQRFPAMGVLLNQIKATVSRLIPFFFAAGSDGDPWMQYLAGRYDGEFRRAEMVVDEDFGVDAGGNLPEEVESGFAGNRGTNSLPPNTNAEPDVEPDSVSSGHSARVRSAGVLERVAVPVDASPLVKTERPERAPVERANGVIDLDPPSDEEPHDDPNRAAKACVLRPASGGCEPAVPSVAGVSAPRLSQFTGGKPRVPPLWKMRPFHANRTSDSGAVGSAARETGIAVCSEETSRGLMSAQGLRTSSPPQCPSNSAAEPDPEYLTQAISQQEMRERGSLSQAFAGMAETFYQMTQDEAD